eukprot:1157203-Pelagomonas_calceolata.AAC.14
MDVVMYLQDAVMQQFFGLVNALLARDRYVHVHSKDVKRKKTKAYASQVQLSAFKNDFLNSKLAQASPKRLTGLA